jgi:putative transposase
MSFIKIYVHTVWTTKDRYPYFTEGIKDKMINHIFENAASKNIFIDQINGYKEHIHCLLSINADQNIAGIVQLLKGESSFWLNKQNIINHKFSWQDEYFAVSIGESQIELVRNYIKNQEKHHQKKSFQQEYEEFIANYKF